MDSNETKPGAEMKWEELLDARQLQEVHLSRVYARDFQHGTTGHNQLMLIDRLAKILDEVEDKGININSIWEGED